MQRCSGVLFILIFVGCSPLTEFQTKSLTDPFRSIDRGQSVGILLTHSFDAAVDPLAEKAFAAECMKQLRQREFKVSLIDESKVELTPDGYQINDLDFEPDLIACVVVENNSVTEFVPEKTTASAYGSSTAGTHMANSMNRFNSESVGEHEVTHIESNVCVTLWSGGPNYGDEIWRGELVCRGDSLNNRHRSQAVATLFDREFPIKQSGFFWENGYN